MDVLGSVTYCSPQNPKTPYTYENEGQNDEK